MESTRLCSDHRLIPVVEDLRRHIEKDNELLRLFEKAFEEIPKTFQVGPDGFGQPRVRDYVSMIEAIDRALATAPQWTPMAHSECVLGCPINEALIWLMNTRTGSELLARADINTHMAAILRQWGQYLSSAASASVLHNREGGWMSKPAVEELLSAVNTAHNAPFQAAALDQVFACDPTRPFYGFGSWDDFFTRRFQPYARPVASPEDDSVLVNPCESQPYAVATDVRDSHSFNVKGTEYCFREMLGHDPLARTFSGGTVFQGWLSLLNYHRWHAPVAGTVVSVRQIPGTYYVANPAYGFENVDCATGTPVPDRQAPDASQKLLSSIATRTVILIRADYERLGIVGFVAIGMCEVSSCVPTVAEGDRVAKGQEMGSFHYGGSSYCLLFQPGVRLRFSPVVQRALAGQAEVTGRCIAVSCELARCQKDVG